MAIYITDDKANVVRHYCTDKKLEKVIAALLDETDTVCGISHPGYTVRVVSVDAEGDTYAG